MKIALLSLLFLVASPEVIRALTGEYYVKEAVARVRTVYYASMICCAGWRVDSSGTNCNIQNKHPTIVSCPKNKTVRATGKISQITWLKPEFKEPFRYGLNVRSTYGGEQAQLPWGDTRVIYVATSQNNNKQVRCAFTITVIPPMPKAVIAGFGRGERVPVNEFQRLVLQCRAEYGKPPPALTWFREGLRISIGTSYRTVNSDYLDYEHAINTLTLNPKLLDDGVTYECRTTPNVTRYSIKIDVTFLTGKRIECDFSKFISLATYTDWVKTGIQEVHGTRSTLLEGMSRLRSLLLRLNGHLSSFKGRAGYIVGLNASYDFNNKTMLRMAITDIAKHVTDGEGKLTALKSLSKEIEVLLRKWDGTIERLRAKMLTWSTYIPKTGSSRRLLSLSQILTLLNSLDSLMERLTGHLTITSGQILDCRNEVIDIWGTLSILDQRYKTTGIVQPRRLPRELRIWIRAELQTIRHMIRLSKEFAALLHDVHRLSRLSLQNTLLSFRCIRKEITANSTQITQKTTVMATSFTFETMTTNTTGVTTLSPTEATTRRNAPGLDRNTSTLVTTTTP